MTTLWLELLVAEHARRRGIPDSRTRLEQKLDEMREWLIAAPDWREPTAVELAALGL